MQRNPLLSNGAAQNAAAPMLHLTFHDNTSASVGKVRIRLARAAQGFRSQVMPTKRDRAGLVSDAVATFAAPCKPLMTGDTFDIVVV